MKKTIGILAHVDAGKTTFSESVLFMTGAIKKKGRVDHQDTHLDTDPMEQRRGITIFSGLAHFTFGEDEIYWLDTPGHADFSPEMERAIPVMDAAILVLSATDGVQSHTETVWQRLQEAHVPVYLFLNKCDRPDADPDRVFQDLKLRLSPDCIDLRSCTSPTLTASADFTEVLAGYDEELLDRFLAGDIREEIWVRTLGRLTNSRTVFPVMSGSALAGDGVASFLSLVCRLTHPQNEECGSLQATCFRVRHDPERLCFLKLLTGTISVRDTLSFGENNEKVSEIRIYQGDKFTRVTQAASGDLIAVPLQSMHVGDSIGIVSPKRQTIRAMTSAELFYDSSIPAFQMLRIMQTLEDEDPAIGVEHNEEHITVHVTGPLQLEILSQQLLDRFGLTVTFGPPQILYHETILNTVIGVGHYEPLRHYAEVHLRLSPAPRGTGIVFRSYAHVDDLALNWQRLIRTHVYERIHKGVLTGSPLTDVYIDLICGRAHLKHTEGGDFRQAVYRAIRQGLMQAHSCLLEPVCRFSIRVPSDQYGSLLGELSRLQADTEIPEASGESVIIRGTCIYSRFLSFQSDFAMRTHGLGSLQVWPDHEEPCHNEMEIIASKGYLPLADDTPDSVFCSHGAGFTVAWDHVRDFAHLSDPVPEELTRETNLD